MHVEVPSRHREKLWQMSVVFIWNIMENYRFLFVIVAVREFLQLIDSDILINLFSYPEKYIIYMK